MKENMLKKIVIDTIKGEQHLGENLKNLCVDYIEKLQNNWNELKKFVDEELDRLARECSQIYEDSLGKTRLVNEDIYNEVKNISNKMQELEGNNE